MSLKEEKRPGDSPVPLLKATQAPKSQNPVADRKAFGVWGSGFRVPDPGSGF